MGPLPPMLSYSGTLVALAAAAMASAPAAAAPGPLSDFRLPAETEQPAEPRQGPVAPDVPESRISRPTPTPTAPPTPAPEPTTPQIVIPDVAASAPAPQPDGAAPVRGRAAVPAPQAAETTEVPLEAGLGETAPPALDPSATPASLPASSTPVTEESGGMPWLWALAALLAIGATGAVAWAWKRRQRVGKIPLTVPQIERPRLGPAPESAPAAAPAIAGEPLEVSLEPLRLSLTLLNAALSYRLRIANRGAVPLTGLSVGADMISAHASLSREEQLAGPNGEAPLQQIERLEPGESRIVESEFRLPFPQIVPIRQGNAALLLPLARFRVRAEGGQSVTRAFVVGQPGSRPGAGLQPFRLDLGPRIYPHLAQRAFA